MLLMVPLLEQCEPPSKMELNCLVQGQSYNTPSRQTARRIRIDVTATIN